MSFEHENLLRGFRYSRIQPSTRYMSANRDSMANKILIASRFQAWTNIDSVAARLRNEVSQTVAAGGCGPNNRRVGRCLGLFRNFETCEMGTCRAVAEAKYYLKLPDKVTESNLTHTHAGILKIVTFWAQKLKRNWLGEVCHKRRVQGVDSVFPTLAIYHVDGRECMPFCTVNMKFPNRSHLLPARRTGSRSLADDYAYALNKKLAGSEDRASAYALTCIAQAVQFAMFTTTGYGCVFNHNQAVFLKVTPHENERNDYTRMEHIVQVSREFKCDSENLSVCQGMLAWMIRAYEESSSRTEEKLQSYYEKLKLAAISKEDRRLVAYRGSPGAGSSHTTRTTHTSRT